MLSQYFFLLPYRKKNWILISFYLWLCTRLLYWLILLKRSLDRWIMLNQQDSYKIIQLFMIHSFFPKKTWVKIFCYLYYILFFSSFNESWKTHWNRMTRELCTLNLSEEWRNDVSVFYMMKLRSSLRVLSIFCHMPVYNESTRNIWTCFNLCIEVQKY